MESSDNDLTELKRGIEQILQKLLNVNQPRRNNNLNAGPKSYKIAKDTIIHRSHAIVQIQVLSSQTDNFLRKQTPHLRHILKKYKTNGITSHGSII